MIFDAIGRASLKVFDQMGGIVLLLLRSIRWSFRPPSRWSLLIRQIEFVGVQSTFIIGLTSLFTGMAFTLQGYYGFRIFGGEDFLGASMVLALARELGPVLSAILVTGRAGSAMCAELGSMRVTEQVDALFTMAVNPIQYLVVPRLLACFLMVPLLTVLFDFLGTLGSYWVAVKIVGISGQTFFDQMVHLVGADDVWKGMVKAGVFGLVLALISCYKGLYVTGGAEGIGRATTQSVVYSSVAILVSDYFLTDWLF